jgi:hypothetical protein
MAKYTRTVSDLTYTTEDIGARINAEKVYLDYESYDFKVPADAAEYQEDFYNMLGNVIQQYIDYTIQSQLDNHENRIYALEHP